jgi:hypothetical protein
MTKTPRQFSLLPESELLVWCARTVLTDNLKERIQQRVQEPLDWVLLLRLAEYHGVSPLLYRNLSTLCCDRIPVESLTHLRQRTYASALLNGLLTQELVILCEAFAAHGVPVIPIKGATLAVSAYGDFTLREFRDIDLIIRECAIPEAQACLSAQGYERMSLSGPARLDQEGPYYLFAKKRTLFQVDLQSVMAHQHFLFPLDRPEFWHRQTPVLLANKTVSGLAPEDLLIVLCVHGSKHAWEELKWVCDVAELLRTQSHLDWDLVFDSALEWRCRRLLLMGLSLAHHLLDAPMPERILARFSADSDIQMLSNRMPCSLLSDRRAGVSEVQAVALYFSLKDSWLERWRFGLMLCRDHCLVVTTPPPWFRWRTSLSRLARLVFPLHKMLKSLLPRAIRGSLNRWVQNDG